MNPFQLNQVLDAFERPAEVVDASGRIVSQNGRAAQMSDDDWTGCETRALGEGLTLRLAPAEQKNDVDILANGMAHAVRNPLSSIVTAASLIRDDSSIAEETGMLIGIIDKESNHLNRIVTDYLNFVRPQRGDSTRFDVTEALRGTIAAVKKELNATPSVIHDRLETGLWIRGDENRLRQALRQVVANAFEAMAEGGVLAVAGARKDDTIDLTVEDDGKGCSDSELPRLFEPFFSNKPDATGLGLSAARSAIEAAGGTIWGERVTLPQGGTAGMRLHLKLPAADL